MFSLNSSLFLKACALQVTISQHRLKSTDFLVLIINSSHYKNYINSFIFFLNNNFYSIRGTTNKMKKEPKTDSYGYT